MHLYIQGEARIAAALFLNFHAACIDNLLAFIRECHQPPKGLM